MAHRDAIRRGMTEWPSVGNLSCLDSTRQLSHPKVSRLERMGSTLSSASRLALTDGPRRCLLHP